MMPNACRRAIATLVSGTAHQTPWAMRMLPGWAMYCERHQIDLIAFLAPLDPSDWAKGRKFTWQKCLMLSQPALAGYEQVAMLDADIAINALHAPDVFANCPTDKLGGVGYRAEPLQPHLALTAGQMRIDTLEQSFVARDISQPILDCGMAPFDVGQAEDEIAAYYQEKGVAFEVRDSFNTGVTVCSPAHHAAFYERIYRSYEDIYRPISDQFAVPAEAFHAGIAHNIDSRFNVQVNSELATKYPYLAFVGREYPEMLFLALQTSFTAAYFLHFAAAQQRQEYFLPLIHDWRDFPRLGVSTFPSVLVHQEHFDPQAVTESYFGLIKALMEVPQRKPQLSGAMFSFHPSKLRPVLNADMPLPDEESGFYAEEKPPHLDFSFHWIDGRKASVPFLLATNLRTDRLVKFVLTIGFFHAGDASATHAILSTTLFVNGYPHISREVVEGMQADGTPHLAHLRYTGYAWVGPGENHIRFIAPNWTAYSRYGAADPRSMSVGVSALRAQFLTERHAG